MMDLRAIAVLVVLLSIFIWSGIWRQYTEPELVCYKDLLTYQNACRPACDRRYFSLPGMTACHPWLSCQHKDSVVQIKKIGMGLVKNVFLSQWESHNITTNTLSRGAFRADFQHGLEMHKLYQSSPLISQFIGHCGDTYYTEYHVLGDARNLKDLLKQQTHSTSGVSGLGLCTDYVQILNVLHSGPHGVRVMCDSNSLEKTLEQLLVRSDIHLVLNDLDALPEVSRCNGSQESTVVTMCIKCGHNELTGDFVAPEQLWSLDGAFDDASMPGYDEMTDIWKVPDVCEYFIDQFPNNDLIKFHVFKMHKACKSHSPTQRPNASELLTFYRELSRKMK